MKLFLAAQLVVILAGTLVIAELLGKDGAVSYAIGSSLIFFNVAALGFVWFHVIQKKLIALSLMIIVFKYAILGVIIYKLLSLPWVQQGWLCVGLGSLLISTLIYAVFSPKKETEDD